MKRLSLGQTVSIGILGPRATQIVRLSSNGMQYRHRTTPPASTSLK
jgi:hypothetical protein